MIDAVIRRMERDETMAPLLASSGAAWHAMTFLPADRRTISRRLADLIEATVEHLRANITGQVSLTAFRPPTVVVCAN